MVQGAGLHDSVHRGDRLSHSCHPTSRATHLPSRLLPDIYNIQKTHTKKKRVLHIVYSAVYIYPGKKRTIWLAGMIKMALWYFVAQTTFRAAESFVPAIPHRIRAFSTTATNFRHRCSGVPVPTSSCDGVGRTAFSTGRDRTFAVNGFTYTAPSTAVTRRFLSTTTTDQTPSHTIPIFLLSGFLGAGKTTTLKHLLENNENVKIGVVVNDVASVNIDAKLLSNSTMGDDGFVQLQNGCACCSLADELLGTVDTLLAKNQKLDAVVVELSGVADPEAIKANWEFAKNQGHPVTKLAHVSKVVTLIDASTFGTDWMTMDLAGQRKGWVEEDDECAAQRTVAELLAEQVESADVILINKLDLADDEGQIATRLAQTLNEEAVIEKVNYGKVSPNVILKDLLPVIPVDNFEKSDPSVPTDLAEKSQDSHNHEHDHAHSCDDHSCEHPSHGHESTDSHDHDSHSCSDPHCSDSSHDHSHTHNHATSTDSLGISSFVYKAERPFDPSKLMALLSKWPVPKKDYIDLDSFKTVKEHGYEVNGEAQAVSPFVGVLRSKGFCWLAPTAWNTPNDDSWRHDTAMFWGHAGKQIGISPAGKWWDAIPREQMADYLKDNTEEYNRILKEDFVTEEFGDRRQEIVFIGFQVDEAKLTEALNSCLLSDVDMEDYRQCLLKRESTPSA